METYYGKQIIKVHSQPEPNNRRRDLVSPLPYIFERFFPSLKKLRREQREINYGQFSQSRVAEVRFNAWKSQQQR